MRPWQVRPTEAGDGQWVRRLLSERWGSELIVTRGHVHHADRLPGFVAQDAGRLLGLATYNCTRDQCELVSLDSLAPRQGVGTALIAAVAQAARRAGARRLWLVTTNDNVAALRFHQKRGFVLAALHPNALELSRRLKPEIPMIGLDGIPLRDEIELEMAL
jgi:N-acetylglutamate synthase-like GNAT family acetyltransferase